MWKSSGVVNAFVKIIWLKDTEQVNILNNYALETPLMKWGNKIGLAVFKNDFLNPWIWPVSSSSTGSSWLSRSGSSRFWLTDRGGSSSSRSSGRSWRTWVTVSICVQHGSNLWTLSVAFHHYHHQSSRQLLCCGQSVFATWLFFFLRKNKNKTDDSLSLDVEKLKIPQWYLKHSMPLHSTAAEAAADGVRVSVGGASGGLYGGGVWSPWQQNPTGGEKQEVWQETGNDLEFCTCRGWHIKSGHRFS